MNNELIKRWNEKVKPEDTVIYLGDFALSTQSTFKYTPLLNGSKILYPGNHDACHPRHKKYTKSIQGYLNHGWAEVHTSPPYGYLEWKGKKFRLCHFPDSNQDPRFISWLHKDNWGPLIHGHCHLAWKSKENMINVGVCQWDYYPVSIEEICELL